MCTLANGYWGSRGAAPEATADDGIHYPGTYLAGVYNRLDSAIAGTLVRDESILNVPNWLPLTVQHADGTLIDADHGAVEDYRHLATRHLQPVAATEPEPGTVLVESVTSQSGIHIALAARTVVHAAGERLTVASRHIATIG